MIWEQRYNDQTDEEFRACLLSAREGDVEAAYRLGWMFFVGRGVKADPWEAASIWHDIVARDLYDLANNPDYSILPDKAAIGAAAFAYFNCSYFGVGIWKEEDHAVVVCEDAAHLGILECQFQLSLIYEEGYVHPDSYRDTSPAEDAYFWTMISSIMGKKVRKDRIFSLQSRLSEDKISEVHNRIFSEISQKGKNWKIANNLFESLIERYPINFDYYLNEYLEHNEDNVRTGEHHNHNGVSFDDIENMRRQCGLTAAEFCDFLGVSRAAYYAWLRGGEIRNSNKKRVLQFVSKLETLRSSAHWHEISRSLHSKNLDSRQKVELVQRTIEEVIA